jgi:hypothetical protein
MVCRLFANTYIGRADELEMKWTMSPQCVNQEDRLLALDLSGDLLQDILDVKYNCKNLHVCLTTIPIRMRTQKKFCPLTPFGPLGRVTVCLVK